MSESDHEVQEPRWRRLFARRAAESSTLELVAAGVGLVFAVLALAGVVPGILAALSAIAIGAGLIGRGAVIAWGLSEIARPDHTTEARAKVGEAAGDEVLGGTVALAFGVLALVGLEPRLLLAVVAVAAGGVALLSGTSRAKLARVARGAERSVRLGLASEAALVIGGVAAIVLGVLAMVGVGNALVLVAIAYLALCAALLLGSGIASWQLAR